MPQPVESNAMTTLTPAQQPNSRMPASEVRVRELVSEYSARQSRQSIPSATLTLSATRHSNKIRKALKRLYPTTKTHRERLESFIADVTLQRFIADLDKDEDDSSSVGDHNVEALEDLQTPVESDRPPEQTVESQQRPSEEPHGDLSRAGGPSLDQMLVFDSAMQQQKQKRRKKFSPLEKQRVHAVRDRGACQKCRMLKKRVGHAVR